MWKIKSILSVTAVMIVLAVGSVTQADIVPADLVAYWKMDGDLMDSVGGNHGTIVDQDGGGDNTSFAAGFDGSAHGALNFAGTDDHMSTALVTPTGAKSMSLFFTTNNPKDQVPIDDQVPAGSHGSQRFYVGAHFTVDGNLVLGVGDGGAGTQPLPSADFVPTGTDVATDDTFHHVVLVDDGDGNSTMYYRSPSDPVHLVYKDPYTGISGGEGEFLIGALLTPGGPTLFASGRVDDVALFNRVLTQEEAESIYAAGSVARLLDTTSAFAPTPADGDDDVLRDVTLTWKPGEFAVKHTVYLGTSFEDVNTATADVLVGDGQDANALDVGRLAFGTTYYWRVDEVNGAPDRTVFKGDVWNFTVEPFSIMIPVDANAVTASSSADQNPPGMTVNGSGLTGSTHGTDGETMWLSATGDLSPWLMFEFDKVQKLDKMLIWNANSPSEGFIGWGIKDVDIEFSLDGIEWTGLDQSTEISRGPGLPTYSEPQAIDLGLAVAKYVRLNILSNWGDLLQQYGVSEVQFYGLPLYARTPDPVPGSVNVDPGLTVRWRAGREADQHTVYVGTDANTVADGTALSVSPSENSADLGSLDLQLGETYAWRVDEVNESEAPSLWEGSVWSFTTADALIVDDFESYTNKSPNRPFQAWLDGYGYSADEFFPTAYGGNGTGAGIGHDIWSPSSPYFDGTIMETTIVYGGAQSMPLYYDNTSGATSETQRTFDMSQDWTASGVRSLAIAFRGNEGNTGQLYVKINNSKVSYAGDAADIGRAVWQLWQIDLFEVGGNLQSVNSLAIGVEGAGAKGMLYIDEIVLSPTPVASSKIAANDLTAYWKLDGDLRDSVGDHHGEIIDQDGNGDNTSFAVGFDGTVNGALDFAATSDHMVTALVTPTGAKSLSLFFTTSTTDIQVPAGSHGGQRFYVGKHNAGSVWVGVGAGGAGSTPLPSANFVPTGTDIATDNTYHHVVLVDDGAGHSTLYYRSPSDAEHLVYELAYGGTTGGAGEFGIGTLLTPGGPNLFASGRVDDVALFNRVLTPAEVESIYAAGSVAAAME